MDNPSRVHLPEPAVASKSAAADTDAEEDAPLSPLNRFSAAPMSFPVVIAHGLRALIAPAPLVGSPSPPRPPLGKGRPPPTGVKPPEPPEPEPLEPEPPEPEPPELDEPPLPLEQPGHCGGDPDPFDPKYAIGWLTELEDRVPLTSLYTGPQLDAESTHP